MTSIIITIDGKPVAKGRARVTRAGFAYTPAKTRKFEAHARTIAQLEMDGRPPITGPVSLRMRVELPVPKSWSKRKRNSALAGDILPTTRPDIDNYVKAGLDALNSIVIADDSQVVMLHARKVYGVDPKITLEITPLDDYRPFAERAA